MMVIQSRAKELINTDPQRRCYNGCHFSSELVWSPWELFEYVEPMAVESRLAFWRSLNDYAVSFRGEGARREYRAEEIKLPEKEGVNG